MTRLTTWVVGLLLLFSLGAQAASVGRAQLIGHVPALARQLTPTGRLAGTNELYLTIGLPLSDEHGLDDLIRQLYDPRSTNYHHFIGTAEFANRFGPTPEQYAQVQAFAVTNGFRIESTCANRLVLNVTARVADVENAFGITLRTYRHPTENRDFFAPDSEPTVPLGLPVVAVHGLDNAHPAHHLPVHPVHRRTQNLIGSAPNGLYLGNDFRNAYVPGTALTGAGQKVGLLETSEYYAVDITNYEKLIGITNLVPLSNFVQSGSGSLNYNGDIEVSLDIEMAIAMAPQLSGVVVYEARPSRSGNYNLFPLLNQMASDDSCKQLSSSVAWTGGPTTNADYPLKQMAAQGQSFFQAAGDSDAYTGNNQLDNSSLTVAPVDSTNLTCVGATTLTMNGVGASRASETVWNYNPYGSAYANIGSSGGVSSYYTLPAWQANPLTTNQGSSTYRNIPDVAMVGDEIYVTEGNGTNTGVAGTSCAAPLWAGLAALLNQQVAAEGGTSLGLLNPALYSLATNPVTYASCFNDITTGDNIGTNTPGLYAAATGYDLASGLGTPNGTNLINALAPAPGFLVSPASQTWVAGTNASLSASVVGLPPLAYQWQLSGTNLPTATNRTLSFAPVTTNTAGNYSLIITNAYGAATSSVAVVTVVVRATLTAQPTNQTVLSGGSVSFSATASGNSPLAWQWLHAGTNLINGSGVTGATTNVLTLTGVTTNSAGSYVVVVTNLYGAATSSAALLIVGVPPGLTGNVTNRTLQCGANTNVFTVTGTGSSPLGYQWSLDGGLLSQATNSTLALTNLFTPNHTLTVILTNAYGAATNTALLAVQDTLPPVLTVLGANPAYVEIGNPYSDAGATAYDTCVGSVGVTTSGSVTTSQLGTNLLTYVAGDGNGNTNTASRMVIVQETNPPTITWSFTNLVLGTVTNCGVILTNLTGTNYLLATDPSGPPVITQSPTNGSFLGLGTNTIILAAANSSGYVAYSTNTVVVVDATPPVIVTGPASLTNYAGGTALFSVSGAACSPIAWAWYFAGAPLTSATNSSLTLTNLNLSAAGNYFVVGTSAGGSVTSSVVSLAVNQFPSAVTLTASPNPAGYLTPLGFVATVTPTNVTGTVQFLTNGMAFDQEALVAGGAVSATLKSLPRGTNLITAIYSGDANDLSATNSLLQVVTNHPPIGLPVSYFYGAGIGWSLAVTNLATNWSDADGDPVSLSAVSPSTNGIVVGDGLGWLTYTNSANVPDQFICTLSDGWGGMNYETVTLLPVFPAINSVSLGASGSLVLSLSGAPRDAYVLLSSTDLTSSAWVPVATNILNDSGLWWFTNNPAPGVPWQFFRLGVAP